MPEAGHYRQRLADCGITLVDFRVRVMMPSEFNRTIERVSTKHASFARHTRLARRDAGADTRMNRSSLRPTSMAAAIRMRGSCNSTGRMPRSSRSRNRGHKAGTRSTTVSRERSISARAANRRSPTSCASLAAKSIREPGHAWFNKYWREQQPRPTTDTASITRTRTVLGRHSEAARAFWEWADEYLIRCR